MVEEVGCNTEGIVDDATVGDIMPAKGSPTLWLLLLLLLLLLMPLLLLLLLLLSDVMPCPTTTTPDALTMPSTCARKPASTLDIAATSACDTDPQARNACSKAGRKLRQAKSLAVVPLCPSIASCQSKVNGKKNLQLSFYQ